LEEFLATDTSRPGEGISLLGRIVGLLGVVLVLGGMGFMATTLRGSRQEIRTGLRALGVLGLVVALGALLEFVGLVRAGGASLSSLVEVPGLAMTLRLVGGLAIAGGIAATSGSGRRAPAYSLSAAVLEAPHQGPVREERDGRDRWDPTSSRWALAGAAAILASFWFDGHTVSKGPRLLHALLNSVHVAAGSVWAGGVIAMASVTWWRYRRGRPTRATELIVRFSSVATVALIAVAGAGLVMAVFVLDSFGELTGTEWGRILLLKTVAVAIAAGGGTYNHFVLLPALQADPGDEELAAELRSTVTAEAILLAFVVVVTAWLVAAAS
jgi:copper transport protein